SADLPKKIANKLNLDYDRITSPAISGYIEDSIQLDKNLAQKFSVHNFPTTIIFNESGNYNGILLEGIVAHDKLITLLQNGSCLEEQEEYYPSTHLRLI
ncbi:DsbA family protein, partial [Lactobacillus sp. XV13L]|nr:DsbA family protein [Lactobacillus sp. XV13L]